MENNREGQKDLDCVFVDVEKAKRETGAGHV